MYTFDNETLFTGYLKQHLANFNLPKYRVYTLEDKLYHEQAATYNQTASSPVSLEAPDIIPTFTLNTSSKIFYTNYIKENSICRYINNNWVETSWHYHYNKKELNQTKNLIIKSNTYDSYTHEYLGNYLRFQRDYNHINLMPLYNCFSNVICQNIELPILKVLENNTTKEIAIFNSADNRYKIYMLPVKLFQNYTIAIDSDAPVEICCGIYNNYLDADLSKQFSYYTYKCYNSLQFCKPILYSALYFKNDLEKLAEEKVKGKPAIEDSLLQQFLNTPEGQETKLSLIQKEANLKMFIKLPLTNTSTITILEGDYRGYSNSIFSKYSYTAKKKPTDLNPITWDTWEVHSNKFITNYDEVWYNTIDQEDGSVLVTSPTPVEDRKFNPITNLQLLSGNTQTQHPFADRLVEYLLGNVITPLDKISDNVKRVQAVLHLNNEYIDGEIEGSWYARYRNILYDYMQSDAPEYNIPNTSKIDCFGYVDKDVEKYYTAWRLFYKTNRAGNKIVETKTATPKLLNTISEEEPSMDGYDYLQESYTRLLGVENDSASEQDYSYTYKISRTPIVSISNVDIYDDLYKDSKKKSTGGK